MEHGWMYESFVRHENRMLARGSRENSAAATEGRPRWAEVAQAVPETHLLQPHCERLWAAWQVGERKGKTRMPPQRGLLADLQDFPLSLATLAMSGAAQEEPLCSLRPWWDIRKRCW